MEAKVDLTESRLKQDPADDMVLNALEEQAAHLEAMLDVPELRHLEEQVSRLEHHWSRALSPFGRGPSRLRRNR